MNEQVERSRKEGGLNMFGRRKKGPDKAFTHAEDCKIPAADPSVRIPWSEIRGGVWEAVCVCGVQYQHDPIVDDRVRNDPLKIGHAVRLSASSTARPIPPCSGSL